MMCIMRSRNCNSAYCMHSITFYRDRWTPLSLVWKPHHNVLTGNYDVNVLIAALEGRSHRVVWHDRRNGASSINLMDENLFGIMLNIPVRKLAGLWKGRHWVTLRRIAGGWYNLDSDLAKPKPFENEEEVKEFLDSVITHGGEVLLVLQ